MMILTRTFLYSRINHTIFCRRNKYIVLLPEIPRDTPETNVLLRTTPLPIFSQLTTEKCINGIGRLVIDYESAVHKLNQKLYDSEVAKNVQTVILPLDSLSGPLDFAWGAVKLLSTVKQNESICNAYRKLHSRILKAKKEKYLSPTIYQAFKELKANEKDLSAPVQRIVKKHLLESRLSGMDLTEDKYQHFQTVCVQLENEKEKYMTKLLESTRSFSHQLEFKDVRNFPRELLRLLAVDPTNVSKGPWCVTLEPHIYHSFMQHCDDRMLRWNTWMAYNVRASSTSGVQLNNSLQIEEIRHLRNELAKIFGFESFAELSMQTKMAGNVSNVLEMITTLHVKNEHRTLLEIEELQQFASRNGFQYILEMWDIPYWQRLHKEELFNVDDDIVQHYFPLPKVLEGTFKLCNKLFNINIKECEDSVDVWHEDVKLYKIFDSTGKEMASFFLDPYSREGKIHGSWMEVGRNRSDVTGAEPLSYLIFNFHPPIFGKPSLLSFEDVRNLLKKMGHLLQHSLTTVPYDEVAGLTNLEWDVVDVCPLLMTHFLTHYETVASLSSHVDSGKTISPQLHNNLVKRNNYMKGFRLTEELFLSALDIELYSNREFWQEVTKSVWSQYIPFPYEKRYARACSFSDIFCDSYPAAYFSRLWAEMIAADVFSAFEEAGLDNKESIQQISYRFRDTFLSLGGGCHPGEVFRQFRGRDPSTEALLGLNERNSK